MRATTETFRYLLRRTGAGDHTAFGSLYTLLAPTMLAVADRDLDDRNQATHVLRAGFCEVWWMAAFELRTGTIRRDVPTWVEGIIRRRCAERRRLLDLIAVAPESRATAAIWAEHLDIQDQWSRFQLAVMLDHHDSIDGPTRSPLIAAVATTGTVGRVRRPLPGRRRTVMRLYPAMREPADPLMPDSGPIPSRLGKTHATRGDCPDARPRKAAWPRISRHAGSATTVRCFGRTTKSSIDTE
jgi:hypothetical protein